MIHLASLLICRVATLPFETLASLDSAEADAAAKSVSHATDVRARDAERLSGLLYAGAGAAVPPELSGARGAVLRIRRAVHQDRLPENRALLEADPLLTHDLRSQVESHFRSPSEIEESRRRFSEACSRQIARDREFLASLTRMPLFRLGLRLAAPSLLRRVESLAQVNPAAWDQRGRHAASKVLAYLGRFTTKTSPNGVFCATGIGRLVDDDGVVLRGENQIARLDFLIHVGESRKITACLGASPEALAWIVPRPNPTLRRTEDGWTYWRPATPRRAEDDEARCEVRAHPMMERFLTAAAAERESADAIIARVQMETGVDVRSFYGGLVDRGILIAEIEIPWSERRPLRALASRCPGAPWAGDLLAIESDLESLSHLPLADVAPRLDEIASRLEPMPRARPLSREELIRCDAATALEVHLPRNLLADLVRLVPRYARFYGAIYPEPLTRESYAARFLKRYPADTPIPVLDFYHGLFEPAGATRPAAFLPAESTRTDSDLRRAAGAAFRRAHAFFAGRARDANAQGEEEVELSDTDWDEITGSASESRFASAVLFQVAAHSLNDVRAGQARVCLNAFFPGAGLSVARLSHLHDRNDDEISGPIVEQIRSGWARQARTGAEFAEITFMHGGRTANAGLRPPIFPLEIELPGDRATPGHDAIPLADLTAAWNTASGRFVVRSVSRGIEILPVIGSGINPEGIVSFLTMVGGQGLQPLGLFPGFDSDEIRAWPRFRYGNVVLFRRRWVLESAEIPVRASAEESFDAIRHWRREHGLPRHVFVHSERDPKPFYVDLGSIAFIDRLRREMQSPGAPPGRVHVTEMLPGPDELWVRDARGCYASEFLVHLDNLDGAEPGRRE